MPKPQAFCIYCGGAGLTKEHLYADWLRDYIPRTGKRHGIRSALIFPDQPSVESVSYRTGDTHARKLRIVCKQCNSGWMSRLQENARPYLVPMLQGRPVKLWRKAQTLLAAWSAMSIMTSEFLDRTKVATPEEERFYLRENQKPPANWTIWIAAAADPPTNQDSLWHHSVATLVPEGADFADYSVDRPNSKSTTVRLGKFLVIHAMGTTILKGGLRRWRHSEKISPALLRIWPFERPLAAWPPRDGLTKDGIDFLANDLFSRIDRKLKRDMGLLPPFDVSIARRPVGH